MSMAQTGLSACQHASRLSATSQHTVRCGNVNSGSALDIDWQIFVLLHWLHLLFKHTLLCIIPGSHNLCLVRLKLLLQLAALFSGFRHPGNDVFDLSAPC